jgi:hypothetical protein
VTWRSLEPGFGEAALAVAAVTIAVLLVAMVRLAILDWRAEKQSRRAWTAIAGIAELATPPLSKHLSEAAAIPTLRPRTTQHCGAYCALIAMSSR